MDINAAVRADMNLVLKALVSFNNGVSAPTTPYAYQMYVDTSPLPGADPIVYIRDGINTAWVRWGYINKTTGVLIPDTVAVGSGVAGYVLTEVARKRISEAKRGKPGPNIGKKFGALYEETKRKISETKKKRNS